MPKSPLASKPAYPAIDGVAGYGNQVPVLHPTTGETVWVEHSPGMSLREHYAGLAMLGFLSGRDCNPHLYDAHDVARSCLRYADALIAELERTAV